MARAKPPAVYDAMQVRNRIAQHRDLGGTKPKVSLGPVRTTRKGVAEERLNAILVPINVATVSMVVMGARPSPPQQARTQFTRAPNSPPPCGVA